MALPGTTATSDVQLVADDASPNGPPPAAPRHLTGANRVSAVETVANWRLFKRRQKKEEEEEDPLSAVDQHELATVIKLQRSYRFNMLLYSKMGSSLFNRKDGEQADWGARAARSRSGRASSGLSAN